MLTYAEVAELLEYRPEVGGSCLVWKKKAAKNTVLGARAGRRQKFGYWEVSVLGRLSKAHHITWLLAYKEWPSKNIDHINGDKDDNTVENLRLCDQTENNQNQIAQRSHRVLPIGVSLHRGKYRARIMLHSAEHHLGVFDTKEEAYAAYLAAKMRLHVFNPAPR